MDCEMLMRMKECNRRKRRPLEIPELQIKAESLKYKIDLRKSKIDLLDCTVMTS